jgi:hypothetical protein
MIYVISTLAALRSERFQECKSTPTCTDRPSLRLQFSCTSSFRNGLQVDKTMRLVIIQDINPLRAYQRTNSHTACRRTYPTFGKYNVGRRWGCAEVVCSESKWMMIMRWTYGQDCRRIHMLLTCRRKTPSASGPRLCSCGLGLVSFSPTIRVSRNNFSLG